MAEPCGESDVLLLSMLFPGIHSSQSPNAWPQWLKPVVSRPLNPFCTQVLGWQQSLALCRPRQLFERLLERVKLLTFGLAAGRGWDDAKTHRESCVSLFCFVAHTSE